jgi:hypothetical protein
MSTSEGATGGNQDNEGGEDNDGRRDKGKGTRADPLDNQADPELEAAFSDELTNAFLAYAGSLEKEVFEMIEKGELFLLIHFYS